MNRFIFIIVSALIMCGCSDKKVETDPIEIDVGNEMAFQDSVLNYMFELRIDHAEIVLAQMLIETSHFTSDVFKENKNMCGMKLPKQRPTTAIGVNRGHAVYKNWKESVIDIAIWQSIYGRRLTRDEYLKMLEKNGYAEDGSYIKTINNKIKSESRKLNSNKGLE